MTNSKTDVINMALHMIGAGSIISSGSDERQAELANTYYDDAVVDAIADGKFSAFLKYQKLAPYNPPTTVNTVTGDQQVYLPDAIYSYAYVLPNDLALTHSLYSGVGFEIIGGIFYTNDADAVLLYYSMPTQLSGFHTKYRKCVAAYIAFYIVNELKGSLQEVSFDYQQKQLALKEAMAYDRKNRHGVRSGQPIWGEFPLENARQNFIKNRGWNPYGEGIN